jgi:hypothetical protein
MPIAPSGALLPTDIGCGTLPLAPRPHTATPTACDSNLDSGNQDMSRLSAFACLNDAPIHALPTYLCALRLLSTGVRCGTLHLVPRPDTHNTTTSAKLALSRPKSYLRAAPVAFCHRACIAPLSRRFLPSTIPNGSRCSTPTPRSQLPDQTHTTH